MDVSPGVTQCPTFQRFHRPVQPDPDPMTVVVGCRRAKTGIRFFDEGGVTLRRRMRAHANFTETVRIVLIAMTVSEQAGAHWPL